MKFKIMLLFVLKYFLFNFIFYCRFSMGIGDWGLGIGDWGLGFGPNPQSPIPNPQSPLNKFLKNYGNIVLCKKINLNYKY